MINSAWEKISDNAWFIIASLLFVALTIYGMTMVILPGNSPMEKLVNQKDGLIEVFADTKYDVVDDAIDALSTVKVQLRDQGQNIGSVASSTKDRIVEWLSEGQAEGSTQSCPCLTVKHFNEWEKTQTSWLDELPIAPFVSLIVGYVSYILSQEMYKGNREAKIKTWFLAVLNVVYQIIALIYFGNWINGTAFLNEALLLTATIMHMMVIWYADEEGILQERGNWLMKKFWMKMKINISIEMKTNQG